MSFCGYEYVIISDEEQLFYLSNKKKDSKKPVNKSNKKINKTINKDKIKRDPNSPFAVLEKLH